VGSIELPLAVGTVGGATRTNPIAGVALRILGTSSAQELSMVMASVGLAQNFAALRALATEGIQAGHMKLHARNIAVMAGAKGKDVDRVAQAMIGENDISAGNAERITKELVGKK
jgi:hydroxymethylglutaryl-CoA reductase